MNPESGYNILNLVLQFIARIIVPMAPRLESIVLVMGVVCVLVAILFHSSDKVAGIIESVGIVSGGFWLLAVLTNLLVFKKCRFEKSTKEIEDSTLKIDQRMDDK